MFNSYFMVGMTMLIFGCYLINQSMYADDIFDNKTQKFLTGVVFATVGLILSVIYVI